MKQQIFRKEALERMSSPEQLDELMPVTSPRGWLALAGIGAVLLLATVWGFVGRIETFTPGVGALVRDGGMRHVAASREGKVAAVLVHVGDSVKVGDVLVHFASETADRETGTHRIVSGDDGRVLYVSVMPGETVREGDVLVGIELPGRPMQAVLCVSTRDGYQVKPGQTVQLAPATGDQYSSQTLIGTVTTAGRFPETASSIFRMLRNPDWVKELVQRGPLLEVRVELPRTDEVRALYFGTPCSAKITVSRKRPIEFVFPVLGSQ